MPDREIFPFEQMFHQLHDRYEEVFVVALQRLASSDRITSQKEDDISKILNVNLVTACREIGQRDDCVLTPPIWERPLPPQSEDDLDENSRVGKRPDFTCSIINRFAQENEDFEIPFHVECKLLGNPTSPTWILNENYIKNGVKRYDCTTHEYGKYALSGMMVGYVISLDPESILEEVNQHLTNLCPTFPEINVLSEDEVLYKGNHTLQRVSVEPSVFKMLHLWVDLRQAIANSN